MKKSGELLQELAKTSKKINRKKGNISLKEAIKYNEKIRQYNELREKETQEYIKSLSKTFLKKKSQKSRVSKKPTKIAVDARPNEIDTKTIEEKENKGDFDGDFSWKSSQDFQTSENEFMDDSTENLEKESKPILEANLSVTEYPKGALWEKNRFQISNCLLELYKKYHPNEYRKFLENKDMHKNSKTELVSLIEAQMALGVLHKHIGPIEIKDFDIREFINHCLKPDMKRIADSAYSRFSSIANDVIKAVEIFDLEEEKASKSNISSRYMGYWVFGLLLTIFLILMISNEPEAAIILIIVTGLLAKIFPAHLFDRSEEIENITALIEKKRPALQRILDANLMDMEKFPVPFKANTYPLEEAEKPIEELFELVSTDESTEKIEETIKAPDIAEKPIEDVHDIDSIIEGLETVDETFFTPDKTPSEVSDEPIESVIDVGPNEIDTKTIEEEENKGDLSNGLSSQESPQDFQGSELEVEEKDKERENVASSDSANDELQPSPEKPYKEILIGNEELKDTHANVDSKKYEPSPVPREKVEYMIYSHDFPHGKRISLQEFQRRMDEFDLGNEKHLFFIFQDGEDYFNGVIPIRFPLASIRVIKILLENASKYVTLRELYNDLTGANLTSDKLTKKQRGYIHRAITDLRTATFKKIEKHLDVKKNFGYKFNLEKGLIFSLIEKI